MLSKFKWKYGEFYENCSCKRLGKKGITHRLKESFLAEFPENTDITEWYLPQDLPNFCCGCATCIIKDEGKCKDIVFTSPIWQSLQNADLLVFTSPVYAFHTTGAMKNLLDHFSVHWKPHRPDESMFKKRAAIITNSIGASNKFTQKDIAHSLSWWGVSEIHKFGVGLMEGIFWDELSEGRRDKINSKMKSFSKKLINIDYTTPAHVSVITKIKFLFCRKIQGALHNGAPSTDSLYWLENGWLDRVRPWK